MEIFSKLRYFQYKMLWSHQIVGNTWVYDQHCAYWCPAAKTSGNQYPQCLLNVLIPFHTEISQYWGRISKNRITFLKKNIQLFNSKCNFQSCFISSNLLMIMSSRECHVVDDKSTSAQVMACCLAAPSHYLSQCWPRSLSPYGITRPHVNP